MRACVSLCSLFLFLGCTASRPARNAGDIAIVPAESLGLNSVEEVGTVECRPTYAVGDTDQLCRTQLRQAAANLGADLIVREGSEKARAFRRKK